MNARSHKKAEDIVSDAIDKFLSRMTTPEPVVIREGAALRTADEQSLLYVEDAISLGVVLSPWGQAVYREVRDILGMRRHIVSGDSDTEGLAMDLARLAEQLESDLATMPRRHPYTGVLLGTGYTTEWDDGYTITPSREEES